MKEKEWFKSPTLVFSLITICFAVYAIVIIVSIWPIESKTIAQAGVFGDSFGVLTALFSGLAFGGLMITIWQQQEDLGLTKQEMREQKFENMLFKMLDVHNSVVGDIDLRSKETKDVTATGRDCFLIFYKRRIRTPYRIIKKANPDMSEEELIVRVYEDFWNKNRSNLGHYFRYVYNIFKFIENSPMKNKKEYGNIVRAQISDYELLMLFYNCLSKYGKERFYPLAVEYELFDNMPKELLLSPSHIGFYPPKAYGEK